MFTVVEGRQSADFNHFRLYNLESIEATETRLMGVVALRLSWRDNSSKAAFYQIIHLDYSEYGIDDYFEYECLPANDDSELLYEEMKWRWNDMSYVMGGRIINISPEMAVKLIDLANEVWEKSELLNRGYDDNETFRRGAIRRVELMKQSLIESGTISENYDELISEEECISTVSKKTLTTYESINYFIMRLVDRDFPAAAFLSTIERDELERSELADSEIQTLMRNSVTAGKSGIYLNHSDSFPYYCKYVSMGYSNYYYASLTLELSGGPLQKDRKVKSIEVGYHKKLSAYEADLLIKRSEYITVYDVEDRILNGFDIGNIPMLCRCNPKLVDNGWLYVLYNSDNKHVDKAEYYLNGDVYGSALLTIAGEFIVMSYKLMNISMLETDIAACSYSGNMTLSGRYEVNNMVFKSVCETTGIMFCDVIDKPDEE